MNRHDALAAIASCGVDIVPMLDESDAYILAYHAEVVRLDEWDPDQPRDEHGMFAGAGGGTVEGAVKSGMSAIYKATTLKELHGLAKSIDKSKVLTPGAKAKLYTEMADKASLGDDESDDALEFSHAAFTNAIDGEEGKDWVKVTDPETGDEVKAAIVSDGNGGQAAMIASGEVVKMPGASSEGPGDEGVSFPHAAMVDQITDGDGLTAAGNQVLEAMKGQADDPEVNANAAESFKLLADKAGAMGLDGAAASYQSQADYYKAMTGEEGKDWALSKDGEKGQIVDDGHSGKELILETGEVVPMPIKTSGNTPAENKAKAALIDSGVKNPTKDQIHEHMAKAGGPPANPNKDKAQTEHAKAARESAKAIVQHAKDLRDQYKKNPTPELKAKLEAAEKAGKAARSAARKAESSKSAAEAQKHAEKAAAHHAKLVGGDDQAKAFVVSKGAGKGGGLTPDKAAPLSKAHEKLAKDAATAHPEGWSAEKIAAKNLAEKTLKEHAAAFKPGATPGQMKAAADALDHVASQAKAAGSYWGNGYTALSGELRDAATPQEKLHTGKTTDGDHSTAPEKSARPINSIKGEVISEKAFGQHRTDYTKTLTADEKAAALRYSGSAYSETNKNLREGGKPTKHDLMLDKAIAKSPAPKDLTVHRGMNGTFVHDMFSNLSPGDQFVEKAYTSTSAGGHAAFGGNVEMHITVPKGYPIAPIPSHHPGEREYLLRRNTKYQVTKIEKQGSKIVAHVTVIHDKKED